MCLVYDTERLEDFWNYLPFPTVWGPLGFPMPLTALFKLFLLLVSLVVLAAAGWLIWSWWDGRLVPGADGEGPVLVRDAWRLWVAGALLAWTLLGRLPATLLLARGDTDPSRPRREAGGHIAGANGSRLYVERRGGGQGVPLVMTHGWGLDSTIWDYASRDLGRTHPMVVWDLPGLGRSEAPADGIKLSAFARDLKRVVEFSGPEPVVLVGHSIGGMAIQTLVRDHPDFVRARVAGIVLINTTYTNPLRTMVAAPLLLALQKPFLEPMFHLMAWLQPLAWLGAWHGYLNGTAHLASRFGFGRYVTRSQLEHVTLLTTRNPPGVQARGNLAMFDWDASEALSGLDVPVLVLGGDRDIVTKPEASCALASSAPAELEIVGGVNHMGFVERSDIYHYAIAAFVERLSEPSRTLT